MIINMFVARDKIANKLEGRIISAVTETLNPKNKTIKDHDVLVDEARKADVIVATISLAVNLGQPTCTCRS